ncbi:hypothetical protein K0M31_000240 [Melipona bicolor]|uniref:Uncharacterized protein n=1 Tax=Melipona bicolor TaxID=60889 RepID=A0AA40GD65_9HYME|nr:hypothetical protein K0M31_000240 [Melipona bicolor]
MSLENTGGDDLAVTYRATAVRCSERIDQRWKAIPEDSGFEGLKTHQSAIITSFPLHSEISEICQLLAAYFNGFSPSTEKLDQKKKHVPAKNENVNIKSLLYLRALCENKFHFDFQMKAQKFVIASIKKP